jgi:hypothetical protein
LLSSISSRVIIIIIIRTKPLSKRPHPTPLKAGPLFFRSFLYFLTVPLLTQALLGGDSGAVGSKSECSLRPACCTVL